MAYTKKATTEEKTTAYNETATEPIPMETKIETITERKDVNTMWIVIENNDVHTSVMNIGNMGCIVKTESSNGVSSSFIPNVMYCDGEFTRII